MIGHLQDALVPSGIATVLFVASLLAFLMRRTRTMALPLLGASALVMLVFSNGLTAALLSSPLEYSYPAMQNPRQYPRARTIAVLTGYADDAAYMPLSARMNASSAYRVLEAANIWTIRRDCRVVVSGAPEAAGVMARQLRLLGIPERSLIVDGDSMTTAESAEFLAGIAGGESAFLVTSAGHMRRAAGALTKRGVNPIPAPTDYLLPRDPRSASWTTSAMHLHASDLAVHEYFGLAWYRLTDRL